METTTVYLIRHAEILRLPKHQITSEDTQLSNEKIILSVKGEQQAAQLSRLPELQNIQVLFSSSYARAIATAKYIADKNQVDIQINAAFNERKLGCLDELEALPITRTYTKEQLLDENLKTTGGENRLEVHKRMTQALHKILEEHAGKTIAVVSHGAALKFLLMNWCELDEDAELNYKDTALVLSSPSMVKLVFQKNELLRLEFPWLNPL